MPIIQPGKNILVTVTGAELGQNEKTGTPLVFIHFVDYKRDTITAYLYLTEKAEEKTYKTLCEVFGFDCDFDTLGKKLTGKQASIEVIAEHYNGNLISKVKWINKPRSLKPASVIHPTTFSERAKAYAQKNEIRLPTLPTNLSASSSQPVNTASPAADDCPF